LVKCEFVDPSNNYPCGRKYEIGMIHLVNPSQKLPTVYYVCGIHSKIRFDALNRADKELQTQYDRNEINWKEKKERQTEIWFRCRKCNHVFEKTDPIWVLIYFKFKSDVQIQIKKAFRLHRDCAIGEQFLYGVGKEIIKDSKLDLFS